MGKNIDQVFIANPLTTNASTDLMYFGQSPYGAGNDAAMTYANFSAQFLPSGAQTANLNMAAHNIQFNTLQGIQDSNGNLMMRFTLSASAVNFFAMLNAATGAGPTLRATGSDATVGMNIQAKGGVIAFNDTASTTPTLLQIFNGASNYVGLQAPASLSSPIIFQLPSVDGNGLMASDGSRNLSLLATGTGVKTALGAAVSGSGSIALTTSPAFVTPTIGAATATTVTFSPTTGGIVGTTTNDNTNAGNVGEMISSVITLASGVTLSTTVSANVTSISLTAGDWMVWGNVGFNSSSPATAMIGWISSTSATTPDLSLYNGIFQATGTTNTFGTSTPSLRFSLSGTTTIYLSAQATFSAGTTKACGGIYARRVR
jgi:hypothetical protein